MASRAIITDIATVSLVSRLDSWRGVFNDAFTVEWDDLASEAIEPNAFAESWFLAPALEQFDPDGRVQIFVMWDQDLLTGMMPIGPQAQYGRWPVPHV